MGKVKIVKKKSNPQKPTSKRKLILNAIINKKVPEEIADKEEIIIEEQPKESFMESLKVQLPRPEKNEEPETVEVEINHVADSEFLEIIEPLTKGYSKPIESLEVMYSDKKGAPKLKNLEQFERYESLRKKIYQELSTNGNRLEKAYESVLKDVVKGSAEETILKRILASMGKDR